MAPVADQWALLRQNGTPRPGEWVCNGGPSLPAPSGPNTQRHLNTQKWICATPSKFQDHKSAFQKGPGLGWSHGYAKGFLQSEAGAAIGSHLPRRKPLKHLPGTVPTVPQLIQLIAPFPFLNSALSWIALTLTVEKSFLKVNAQQFLLLPRPPQRFLHSVMALLQFLKGRAVQHKGSQVPCLSGEGKVLARSVAFSAALHTSVGFSEKIVTSCTHSPWETNNPYIEQCCLKVSPW